MASSTRRTLAIAACLALFAPALGVGIGALFVHFPEPLRQPPDSHSVRFEDRFGQLLREVREKDGALSQWVSLKQMPPLLPQLLIATEDRRFHYHPGVDPIAVIRAAVHDLWRLRVVSGASTLSMQLARSVRPHRRNVWGKCYEMMLALRIEASLTKSDILEQYLNRIDFGPNLRGIGAAAQAYFGKPVSALSVSEMAMLVGLPQGPSIYALQRHPERAHARRQRVLHNALDQQIAPEEVLRTALDQPLQFARSVPAFGAPHLVTALLQDRSSGLSSGFSGTEKRAAAVIRTTIDPAIQRASENALSAAIPALREHHVSAGAVLVINNGTGDILAYVGSPDFFDGLNQGQVDGVRARRQPGSTLKPFVYAAAIEELGYTPATVLPDLELHLKTAGGEYSPRNYDNRFHGPVRLREALGNSLNVPAVYVAAELGPATLLRHLHGFGFASLDQASEYYGPALALGDGEVMLLELVRAYSALARGGTLAPVHAILQLQQPGREPGASQWTTFEAPAETSVTSSQAAYLIRDVLKDNRARTAAFGLESPLAVAPGVAAKTGTSKGFRDNWVVGFSEAVTVGVWVGNFDGSPMHDVSGIAGAGPIFRSIMEATLPRYASPAPADSPLLNGDTDNSLLSLGLREVQICPLSGQARGPYCPHSLQELVKSDQELPPCSWHQHIAIDKRNGLLAGPECPASSVIFRDLERFPEPYLAWAKLERRTLPPDRDSPNCPFAAISDADTAPVIAEPMNDAHYVLDPERPAHTQQLTIQMRAPERVQRLSLRIDGRLVSTTQHPFTFSWPIEPGDHRLQGEDDKGKRSQVVTVHVRSTESH